MSGPTRSHDDIAELLGAYALHAVDDDERAAVDEHLETCPRCRAEVREHTWVATQLGNSGGSAPDGLWERIAGTLEETAPPMRLALSDADARVIPLAPRQRRVTAVASIALTAAAVVVIALLGARVVRQDDRIDTLEEALGGAAEARAAVVAFADGDSARADLASADGTLHIPAAIGQDGTGYLLVVDLPALESGRTYQLWGQTSTGLISLGLLGADPVDFASFHVADEVAALAITDEHGGGVVQPSNPPLVLGQLD